MMREEGEKRLYETVAESGLSLTAEALLLAIDPGKGGLFAHDRRRFRKALAATYRSEQGRGLGLGLGAPRRSAIGELEREGLVGVGSLRLSDRPRATAVFQRVRRCIQEDEVPESRDWELLLLLAWSGVLIRRLGRQERRAARRELRELVPPAEEDQVWRPQGAARGEEVPAWIVSLGGIRSMSAEVDLFDAPGLTDFGRDSSAFRPGF